MEIKTIAKPLLIKIKNLIEVLTENRATEPSKSEKLKRFASYVNTNKPYEELIWTLGFPDDDGISDFSIGLWLNKPNAGQLKVFDEIYDVFKNNTFSDYKFEKHPNGVWVRIPIKLNDDENIYLEKIDRIHKYIQIILPEIIKKCHGKIAGVKSKINVELDYVKNWNLNSDQVIISAGSWAQNIAVKYGIYECQNYRSFRNSRYMSFYFDGRIEMLFEIIDKPYDNANAVNTPEIAKMAIELPNYNGNILRRCFKLKKIESIGPIINDTVGKSGKKVPFTYGQPRYTTVDLIQKAKITSELIHGLNADFIIDIFVNDKKTISPKIDILWVIDNSGSMSSYQNELGTKFKSFIDSFINKPVLQIPDFRIAVTTTDESDNGKFFLGSLNYGLSKDNAIDPDLKDDFLRKFNRVVRVGSSGSAVEKGLKCAYLSVKNNENFFRLDSPVVINIVTDEEDDDTTDVNYYIEQLNLLKSGQRVIINLIGLPGFKRYGKAVNKTKGIYLDIKSDFSKILESISLQMVEVTEAFALTKTPVSSQAIKCSYDGTETKDFEFNVTSNTIKAGKSIPDGVTLEIEYEIEEN